MLYVPSELMGTCDSLKVRGDGVVEVRELSDGAVITPLAKWGHTLLSDTALITTQEVMNLIKALLICV